MKALQVWKIELTKDKETWDNRSKLNTESIWRTWISSTGEYVSSTVLQSSLGEGGVGGQMGKNVNKGKSPLFLSSSSLVLLVKAHYFMTTPPEGNISWKSSTLLPLSTAKKRPVTTTQFSLCKLTTQKKRGGESIDQNHSFIIATTIGHLKLHSNCLD